MRDMVFGNEISGSKGTRTRIDMLDPCHTQRGKNVFVIFVLRAPGYELPSRYCKWLDRRSMSDGTS